mgnify:FL=1
MKKLLLSFLLSISFSTFADSSEIHLKCKTGFFTSSEFKQIGEYYYLDGIQYPETTKKINDMGTLWATIREVQNKDKTLLLRQYRKNLERGNIEAKAQSFEVNLEDLSFVKSTTSIKYSKRIDKLSQKLLDFWLNSSGKCDRQ